MKCDLCDSEATVHEVMIKGGQRHEKHLCESCARQQGMSVTSQPPVTQILTQFVAVQAKAAESIAADIGAMGAAGAAAASSASTASVCPACGMTYANFRNTGLLGCPACYSAFEGQLGPLLARAHEGGTHHVGKAPHKPSAPLGSLGPMSRLAPLGLGEQGEGSAASQDEQEALRERIAVLQKQLSDAIAGEQYEKAAKLRDQMTRLQAAASASGGGGRGGE